MVEIRKNKREENLLKKRREGLQLSQPFPAPVPANNIEKKVFFFFSFIFFVIFVIIVDTCFYAD